MSIQSLYNSVAYLYSNEITGTDDIGGIERGAVYVDSFACYFTMLTGTKQVAFGKDNIVSTHRLFCDIRDMKTTDLLLINSLWYEILYIDNCNNMSHHFEVYLYRADAPQIFEWSSSSSSSTEWMSSSSSSSSSSASSDSSSSSSD